jgi:hypothetical protein
MIDHLDCTAVANLVAIDVAKDWNVVLVREGSGNRRNFKFANRKPDHDRLVAFLKSLPGGVIAGLEPPAIITVRWRTACFQKAFR